MSGNRTRAGDADAGGDLAAPEPGPRGDEALRHDALFREVTGFRPVLWGPSILGYGRYHYRYDSGRAGYPLATGFSPCKDAISICILPGYADFGAILKNLAPTDPCRTAGSGAPVAVHRQLNSVRRCRSDLR